MDHRQSYGQPSQHTPQHPTTNIGDRPQQLPQAAPLPRPSYAPANGAIRGRGITGRGLPSMCFACFRQLPTQDLVLCYCYHNYCHECVASMIEAALGCDDLYPVRCCKTMIPLEWETLRTPREIIDKYERRKVDIEARGTVYCHRKNCRAPIHPQFIMYDEALCTQCQASTCAFYGTAVHAGLACGERERQELERLRDLAATHGWGKCSFCGSYIQLSTGLNHLMCACGAETCFSCGKTWQTCVCIQPDHNAVTDELGQGMQAVVDSGRLDHIINSPRRHLERPMVVKYENYLTVRMQRHLDEVRRLHTGIRAVTGSGGLGPGLCKHERAVSIV
ncbi:hypothetical protein GGI43DRAFT_50562 [Trichoderma evansii]